MKYIFLICLFFNLFGENYQRIDYMTLKSSANLIEFNSKNQFIYYDSKFYFYDLNSNIKYLIDVTNVDNIQLSESGVVFGSSNNKAFIWNPISKLKDFSSEYLSNKESLIVNIDDNNTIYGSLKNDNNKWIPFYFDNSLHTLDLPITYESANVSFKSIDGVFYGKIFTDGKPFIYKFKDGKIESITNYSSSPINFSSSPINLINNQLIFKSGFNPNSDQNNLYEYTYYDIISEKYFTNFKLDTSSSLPSNYTYDKVSLIQSLQAYFLHKLDLIYINSNGVILVQENLPKRKIRISKLIKTDKKPSHNYSSKGRLTVIGGSLNKDQDSIIIKNKKLKLIFKITDAYGKPVKNEKVFFEFAGDQMPAFQAKTDSSGKAKITYKITKFIPNLLYITSEEKKVSAINKVFYLEN